METKWGITDLKDQIKKAKDGNSITNYIQAMEGAKKSFGKRTVILIY